RETHFHGLDHLIHLSCKRNGDGTLEREAQAAISIPFAGQMDEMVKAMEVGFPRLGEHVEKTQGTPAGPPFTAYHEVDLKRHFFRCDMGLPVAEGSDKGDFQYKSFVGGKYFKVTLLGSYDFLEHAWYSAMSHLRMIKLKLDKSRPTYEVYENDPCTVASTNEILTSLYIPLK
ncbi:MAG: GyrI-like domain-containing protein, partial [Gammaproteobacteria bacterium]|nr:GyrI-like domain-containing protein [Gammaproteobacteria bacterium]